MTVHLCSPLLIRDASEKPLIYQIIAANEEVVQPAVEKLHKLGADGIDLNLGCPAPAAKKAGGRGDACRESRAAAQGAAQIEKKH